MAARLRLWLWLRRGLLGLVGLLAAILALLLALIWIPPASRALVGEALSRWDARVPATLAWRSMDGSLGAGLVLRGVELRDGEGRPLAAVERLELELRWLALLRGTVAIEQLGLTGVEVWADHEWADLADPDAPEPPPKPKSDIGPDLPVEIVAALALRDGRVWQGGALLVELARADLRARGEGREAAAELHAAELALPAWQLDVDALALALRWDAPVVIVDALSLDAASVELAGARGRYDLEQERGALTLAAAAPLEPLGERLDVPLARLGERVELRLRAEGGPAAVELGLALALDDHARLQVHAAGVPTGPVAQRRVGARISGELGPALLPGGLGPLRFELLVDVDGRESGLAATARAEAHELTTGEQLELRADATIASLDPLRARATVELAGAGLELDARLRRSPERLGLRWSLASEALARPLALAAALVDQPQLAELRGRVDADGRCSTATPTELDTLTCVVDLRLRRAAGFGVSVAAARLHGRLAPLADPLALAASLSAERLRVGELALASLQVDARGTLARLRVDGEGVGEHERLRLAGAVGFGERIDVELDRLELRSDRAGAPIDLALRRPTRIAVGDGAVDVDGLSLALAGGRVDIDGRLGLAAEVASELAVDVDRLALARLDPLIPGPALAGVLTLEAALTGTLAAPRLRLAARARALRIAEVALGELELAAALGPVAPPELAEFAAVEPAIAPTLADAPASLPRAGSGLCLRLRIRGPLARRLELAAAIPVELGGGFGLARGQPIALRLAVERLRLVELGGLMPAAPSWWRQRPADAAAPPGEPRLIPEGLVDLDLALAGTREDPRLAALLRARSLRLDRAGLGSLFAQLGYADGLARVELFAKPGFAQLELRGRVPLTVELADPRVSWARTDDRQRASIELRGLSLAALCAALGPNLPALAQVCARLEPEGLLAFAAHGSGSLAAPRFAAALRGGGLRANDEPLGRVRLFADYEPGEASVDLWASGPLARRFDVHLQAPVELALLDADQPVRVDLSARALAQVHVEALSLTELDARYGGAELLGQVTGAAELRGPLADPSLDLRAHVDELGRAGVGLGHLLVRGGYADGRARLDADLIREGEQVLAFGAELPVAVALTPALVGSTLRWDRRGHHRVFAAGRRIDDALLSALFGQPPEPPGVATGVGGRATRLAFDLSGGGDVEDFRVDGAVVGRVLVDEEVALALDARLDLDEARQQLTLALAPSDGAALTGSLALEAAVPQLVAGEQAIGDVPFTLDLRAPAFELRSLASLLPRSLVDPRGLLRADVRGRGRLAAPRLSGRLALADGALTLVPMRLRLTDMALALDFADGAVELADLSLRAGQGSLRGTGSAELRGPGELEATLDLRVNKFPLIRPGLPAMVIDAGVGLRAAREPGVTRVDVDLREPEVFVAGTTESPPEPIPRSDDVEFVRARATDERGEAEQPRSTERLRLSVDLREPLLISGAAIDMAWVGALVLDVDGGAVEAGGELESRRGTLRLFGDRFELRRGVVTLPDDTSLDPFLDLEAVAALPQAEVTVTVRGRLSRPALEFSSSPPLSDYQILTLLVTGSTELGEGGEADVAAEAASLLAAVSSPQLQNQLQRRLGIDRAAIGFGETVDQPILTVGKRITRDVYVETTYHHNAPEDQNTTEVAVQYGFLPRWSFESYFGDAAVGGFGVYWVRSFPAPAWSADFDIPDLQIGSGRSD